MEFLCIEALNVSRKVFVSHFGSLGTSCDKSSEKSQVLKSSNQARKSFTEF